MPELQGKVDWTVRRWRTVLRVEDGLICCEVVVVKLYHAGGRSEISIVDKSGKGVCPLANALVNGIGDGLVGKEKCDVVVLLGYSDDVVDNSESVDDGEEVSLDLEVVLSDVNGNDEMRPLGSGEFFNEGLVFLMEKGEPCMW